MEVKQVNQIICIGDRNAGKTHLCLEILNPNYYYSNSLTYEVQEQQ
jgi:hypothetical protein